VFVLSDNLSYTHATVLLEITFINIEERYDLLGLERFGRARKIVQILDSIIDSNILV
jgi:hypothetical protein